MAKKELNLHAVVSPAETVVVSAYNENGNAEACTLAFYMVSSHIPPMRDDCDQCHSEKENACSDA